MAMAMALNATPVDSLWEFVRRHVHASIMGDADIRFKEIVVMAKADGFDTFVTAMIIRAPSSGDCVDHTAFLPQHMIRAVVLVYMIDFGKWSTWSSTVSHARVAFEGGSCSVTAVYKNTKHIVSPVSRRPVSEVGIPMVDIGQKMVKSERPTGLLNRSVA